MKSKLHEVKNSIRLVQGKLLKLAYRFPTRKMRVIGITGTEGKTTTATITYELLRSMGKKVGLISTIEARIGEEVMPTGLHVTTPDLFDLYKLLGKMRREGVEIVVMEVTSHSLAQNRVAGLKFDAAVYTNVTWEHLDYHGNYENYLAAKARLIGKVKKRGSVILNADDKSYDPLSNMARSVNASQQLQIVSYSVGADADIVARDLSSISPASQIQFSLEYEGKTVGGFSLGIPGDYNVSNTLAAFGACAAVGLFDWNRFRKTLVQFDDKKVKGRWNILQQKPFMIVNDFAHSPNAYEKMLKAARAVVDSKGSGRIILVFGSAGERDREKRPVIGEIAAKYADLIILTADDPRSEKLEDINDAIAEGIESVGKHKKGNGYLIIDDRREAIKRALAEAMGGDIVIIAGKGHEQSLAVQNDKGEIVELEWDDEKVVREMIGSIAG